MTVKSHKKLAQHRPRPNTDSCRLTVPRQTPMTSIIEAFKYATLGQGFFSWFALGYSFLFMSVLLLFSVLIFNKVQRNFMDTV